MITEKKRKRLIRSFISVIYCIIELCVVLAGVKVVESAVVKFQPTAQVSKKVAVPKNKAQKTQATPKTSFTGCIDAGHGGHDGGSGDQGRLEKDDNLALALEVEKALKEQGIRVVMTRSTDVFLELKERCEIANANNADYFISIHRNTGAGAGVENWIASNAGSETRTLGKNILTELSGVGIQENRGVKQGTHKSKTSDYYVNRYSEMASCIVEMGFINNEKDNQFLDQYKSEYAKAISIALKNTWQKANGTKKTNNGGEQAGVEREEKETAQQKVANQLIENVEALDNTTQDWGQGVNMDEQNRPLSAIEFQDKYANYNALFLMKDSKDIFLTFDIGYENGHTESILNTLKEKNVKAVFFLTGYYVENNAALVERMIAEGHVVGNHTVSHPADGMPSLSIEQQQQELQEQFQYVKEKFNYEMYLFRYPAGKFSDQSLAVVNNQNYKSLFWSFAYLDYDINNQPDQTESLNKMIERLHPGAIYLLHAESETNMAVLGEFIDKTRAENYNFGLIE